MRRKSACILNANHFAINTSRNCSSAEAINSNPALTMEIRGRAVYLSQRNTSSVRLVGLFSNDNDNLNKSKLRSNPIPE